MGTNDIRSYFDTQIDALPDFVLNPRHHHATELFEPAFVPQSPQQPPEINLTPTEETPILHQQTLHFTVEPDIIDEHWGYHILDECDLDDTIRFHLINANGLPYHKTESTAYQQHMHERHVDINGVCELKFDGRQYWIKDLIRKTGRDRWDLLSYATSSHSSPTGSHRKPGRTMTMVHGHIAANVLEKGDDPKMGRWSYMTLQGRHIKRATFITAYRVCRQKIDDVGPNTSYFQQWHYLRQQGIRNPDPRKQCLDDLAKFIDNRRNSCFDYEIVLGMDANGSLRNDPAFLRFLSDTGMFTVHEMLYAEDYYFDNPLPETYKRGSEKVDFITGTAGALLWLQRGGIGAYDKGVPGDHRSLFADFQLSGLLNTPTNKIAPMAARVLKSNNIKMVREYRIELHRLLLCHNIISRIERLHLHAATHTFKPSMEKELEKIDNTVQESKLSAERHCKCRFRFANWSPKLVVHALTAKF